MKSFFLFLFFALFIPTSLFAQTTIDFDTTGQNYTWTVFANGTGDPTDFEIIPNPNPDPAGINTSPTVAKFKVNADAAVYAGVFTEDLGSFIVNSDNAVLTIMVHKEVISDCAFKFEGPNGLNHEIKAPNTEINKWEKITFDFTADIGKEVTRIVFFPDFPPDPRLAGSLNYFDNIEFVPYGTATINFDPIGQGYSWYVFANGTGDPTDFQIIPNPNPSGINTSPSVAKFKVNADAEVYAGAYTESMGSFIVTTEYSKTTIMVHKEVISDCAFKFEGPGWSHEIKAPNTVINQWEQLTFDFTADIGQEVTRIVFFPDFPAIRTAGSMNYFDNIDFSGTIVPVELTSFTAQYVGNTTQLNWTTATELNNLGFDIQRSTNGSDFVMIDFVFGKGTITEIQNYTYVDKTTLPNTNYSYRLKQIDYSGSYHYSEVVNLGESNPLKFELAQNYPNPFNPATTISIGLPVKSDVTLDVYNIVGERVLSLYNGELAAGNYNYTVDASTLSSGIYIYVLNAVGEDGKNSTLSRKMTLLK